MLTLLNYIYNHFSFSFLWCIGIHLFHCIPQGTIIKIRSTIDLYYAIPATVFLAVLSSYVRFFQLPFCDDFNVTGAYLSFFFLFYSCNSFLLLAKNTYLLTCHQFDKNIRLKGDVLFGCVSLSFCLF